MAALGMWSCERKADFIGQWTAENPQDITASVPSASRATSVVTINFTLNDSEKGGRGGSVLLTGEVSASQPVEPNESFDQGYEVNIAATGSLAGTWRYEDDDDDDLILSLDPSSLVVDIDDNGVTFTQNLLTGAQQPMIDSLTQATAEQWKVELTRALSKEFSRYTKLDYVEVNKDGVLSFEISNPEVKLYFVK